MEDRGEGGGGRGGGGGGAHCIAFHSARYYKENIVQFDNYWGVLAKPQPPLPISLFTCLAFKETI